jgi:dTDP-4-amino-4,6-dideoxygalactose transaminase
MKRLNRSPTKFGGGVGLQWRGMKPSMLNRALWSALGDSLAASEERKSECFLFESARSALFHALTAMGVGHGAEVIVSAFTCDAVTYAVMRTGAAVVYVDINDDLTMNAAAVMAAMTGKTKAVVVQNTLGRVGLDAATISQIKASGVLVVEDCALSIGSRLGDAPHGVLGDISTWSLEASKTLTIGWGGVLNVNDPERFEIFRQHYLGLKCVPIWLDLLRVMQLWVSVLLTAHPPPLGIYLWYFLYGFRVFRRSSDSQQKFYTTHARLGAFSASLFHLIKERSAGVFRQTNENYMTLGAKAKELGLHCPIVPDEREFLVSPRFSLIVGEDEREVLTQAATSAGIELGRWFDQAPPHYGLNLARVSSSANAQRISGLIINLPCHWSLSPNEIQSILNWMETIVSVRSRATKPGINES